MFVEVRNCMGLHPCECLKSCHNTVKLLVTLTLVNIYCNFSSIWSNTVSHAYFLSINEVTKQMYIYGKDNFLKPEGRVESS